MFERGGNAVDAACAMLAATATLWDTLGWGGETQALVYHPGERRVLAVNALGTAPTGATPEFFRQRKLRFPPEHGPLAAVVPGTPAGLMAMLSEWGRLSLADVLQPALELARGYPIEEQLVRTIERHRDRLEGWPASRAVFFDAEGRAPRPGSLFRQPDLARTLERLLEAEREALAAGKSRKEAIRAARDRFYRGDLAAEIVAATRDAGGLLGLEDLASYEVRIEEPRKTTYRDIEVHKLDVWTQGPVMLQALNLLEPLDLRAMGYNSARYLHTLYQVFSLAFADRDFYYGDPAFPPEEPVAGLLSKAYARERLKLLDPDRHRPDLGPGDPYPFQGGKNPFADLLKRWQPAPGTGPQRPAWQVSRAEADDPFHRGTTSVVAADREGWVVAMTPSGAWVPAFVAGSTGIGLSQRMQSFVVEEEDGPFNVVAPGKRPRVTLTPTLALRNDRPWLAAAVQGGDSQDQNLLQFFLNLVEFGMTPQEAAEAANLESQQLRSSFGDHTSRPGRMILRRDTPSWVLRELERMGYRIELQEKTSGPINAVLIDPEHGTFWGASSDHGEDYGIGW